MTDDRVGRLRTLGLIAMRQAGEIQQLRARLIALGHDPGEGPPRPRGPLPCRRPLDECDHLVHCPRCGAGSCSPGDAEHGYCGNCGYLEAAAPAKLRGELPAGQDDLARCRVCGCTEDAACEGGCHWAPDPDGQGDLCNRCVGAIVRVTVEDLETGERVVRGVPAGTYAIWATEPCSYTVAALPGGYHQIVVSGVQDPTDGGASPDDAAEASDG